MSKATSARAFPELSVFSMDRFDIPMASEYASNSCVLRAWDRHLERQVALKYSIDPLIVSAIEKDEIARRDPRVHGVFRRAAAATRRYNLHREARLLALIDHPNVISVIDIGRFNEGLIGLLMPWLDGGTVADRDFSGSWEDVLDDALQIGRGVAAIHEAGLLHRDLKPRNILFDHRGRPRVADLGLACLIENSSAMAERVGTRAYMPPGVFESGYVDVRDDLYAYCLIVYEMFYGSLPFADPDARGPIPRPKRPGGIPRKLHAILERGLAENPEDRWPNMPTLLSQMEAVRQPARSRRRGWIAAAGGLGLAASFAVGMFASQPTVFADACDEVGQELEPAWDEDVRAELRGAFGTRKAGDGLQEWAKRWYETRAQECEAAKADEREIVATACSASVRDRFLATVHAFRTPHLRAGLRFAAVIADLPAPEYCLDHPDDGEWGYGGLLELRDIDVEVQALAKMEDLHAAWERQQAYMDLALELGSKHGIARAIFWRGELRRLEGDLDGATTDFGLAYAQAWELGLGVFGAEVQMKQAALAGAKGELAAVDAYASSARGVFETYRPDRVAEVLQVQGLALVAGTEDERERGLALLGRAVELRELEAAKFPGTRERLSQAHESYATGLIAIGRASEAIEYLDLALDVHQDEYGHGTWRTRGILRQKFLALVELKRLPETQVIWPAVLNLDAVEENWNKYIEDAHWFATLYKHERAYDRAAMPLRAARERAAEHGLDDEVTRLDAALRELMN